MLAFVAELVVAITSVAGGTQPGVRSVDFANHTYPIDRTLRDPRQPRSYVTLRAGETAETQRTIGMHLTHVVYCDVTGDGMEEAIVRLGIHTGGSSMPNAVYIFTWNKDRLKLLWAFITGDRADGGYRNVYADQGELVVELYGKARKVGANYNRGDEDLTPACCPKYYTRTRYRWDRGRFRQQGALVTLSNPDGHGSPAPY